VMSWKKSVPDADIILMGPDEGIKEAALELNVIYERNITLNKYGTPLLDSAFKKALEYCNNGILAYVNCDILLLSDFNRTLNYLKDFDHFLMVGQRIMLEINDRITYEKKWEQKLKNEIARGYFDARNAIDYFIFDRESFKVIPPFAVGRVRWDNWMIYEARRKKIPVIDATLEITAIHQKHDYSHLKYNFEERDKVPEALENLLLAGGENNIFDLDDTDWVAERGQLRKRRFTFRHFKKYARCGSGILPFSWFWSAVVLLYDATFVKIKNIFKGA
jgi:hypothetical protein